MDESGCMVILCQCAEHVRYQYNDVAPPFPLHVPLPSAFIYYPISIHLSPTMQYIIHVVAAAVVLIAVDS